MRKMTKVGMGGLGAVVLAASAVGNASADLQPRGTDAVGVGSDTVQYVVDFLADGNPAGAGGYNTTNNARRIVSFDATADASGRAGYQNGTSSTVPFSAVLRANKKPVTRPNGSGAGISAFNTDTTVPYQINFVRSSRLPSVAEQTTATTAGFGGLHVYRIATDGLQIAVNSTAGTGAGGAGGTTANSNAPAGLSCNELVQIYKGTYKTWSDVPSYTGPAPADGIVPIMPQAGSGTQKDFAADLQACNGGTAVTLGGNVVTSEEHDPAAITNIAAHTDINGNPVNKLDAIAPFSTGRDKLIDTGYFGTTPGPNTVFLLNGASPDGLAPTSYLLARNLYIICRDNDVTSATPFQVGGALNMVNTLFGTSTSWFAKSANSALLSGAGVTQSWADLGLAHS